MAVKYKLNATEFEALGDDMKKEYKIQADMSYLLDLGEGMFVTDKDPAGLMSALENEREETKKAKAAADRLEQSAKDSERSKITDVEELKLHFQKELDDRDKKAATEKRETEKQRLTQQQTVADSQKRQQALQIASDLFGSNAPLMLPHIEAGLKAVAGDVPKVEIVDPATGLPSVDQNFDNWKKTLSTNPLYAPMIVVSKASGGSANDGRSSGLPSGTTPDGKPKTYADYTPADLFALKKQSPELFQTLREQRSQG